jgi:NhaP-type Na+/H+ or K+/H+ antiporter
METFLISFALFLGAAAVGCGLGAGLYWLSKRIERRRGVPWPKTSGVLLMIAISVIWALAAVWHFSTPAQ